MEGSSRNGEACPKLLNLIQEDREWHVKMGQERKNLGFSEEKKLELRLGPPGEDWSFEGCKIKNNNKERADESVLSLGYFNNSPWSSQQAKAAAAHTSFLRFSSNTTTTQNLSVMAKESSQPCSSKVVDLQQQQQQKSAEKKAFSTPSAVNTAVPTSTSQKRAAPAPVVGWPPIRSFRKNLASGSSSKPASESQNVNHNKPVNEKPMEACKKGMFVKINMDGVPIGRKVDLKAYDSYEKLSSAVDELFRGLLAAQRDSSAGGTQCKPEEEKAITGLLDGSGEYTLVYEDNEGDKMLLGDVPWHMFVSTVKRLRVLKTSEVSSLNNNTKQDKLATRR